ncbi:AbiH family protein [Flavobacterium sp.]|jgi:hypothetical protein|uniref:AbiH family protein n=1 Tax=Flavobacterium sp. TaxID=239 RepID=UPI0037C0A2A3
MNRLIIIGNGFDLAHGLKTSYHDFILHYLKDNCGKALSGVIKNSRSQPHKEFYHYKDELLEVIIDVFYDKFQLTQEIINTTKIKDFVDLADKRGISFNYFFKILEIGVHKFAEYNWVDFEIEYFNELNRIRLRGIEVNKNISELNIHFDNFKATLETYLKEQQNLLANSFDRKSLCDCFCEDILDRDVDLKAVASHSPNRLLFLNFNYTNTLEPYVEECQKRIPSDINYIHGSLNDENNPPIFGFGDEFDKQYKEFEDEGNNELFKHIKSFGYLKTNNYSNLTRFLDSDKFQVQIFGHSCGLSDRTMFKEIFEHENCLSVKLFYHVKEDDSDDYTDKTYELYRHFSDKNSMRKKIVDKQKCRAMPQPSKV